MQLTIGMFDVPVFRELIIPDEIHVSHHPFPNILFGLSEMYD